MNLTKILPNAIRDRIPLTTKLIGRRMLDDIGPSLAFSVNPSLQSTAKRELGQCCTVQDYIKFTQRYMGVGAVQHLVEIDGAISYMASDAPKRVCEIGTDHGGTTLLLGQALPDVEIMIGIDLYIRYGRHLKTLKRNGQAIHLFNGSSYTSQMVDRVKSALKGEKLDVLFIDGDHRYGGVTNDFLYYRNLVRENGFILFHDIVPDHGQRFGAVTEAWSGGVPELWTKLKQFYPHKEFVKNADQDGMGIGVLRYSSTVELPKDIVENDWR